jgi:hypothetical protein
VNIQRIINEIVSGHEKTSSAHYTPVEVVSTLEKIASSETVVNNSFSDIVKIAADTITSLANRQETLEKAAEVRELLDSMVDNGLINDSGIEKKANELMSKSTDEINIVKEAVSMISDSTDANSFFDEELQKTASTNSGTGGMFGSVISK